MATTIGSLVFQTRLDKSGLMSGLKELSGTRATVGVDVGFDDRGLNKVRSQLANANLELKVTADDRALVDLERSLDRTVAAYDRAQQRLNGSPLTPKVDLRELEKLEQATGRLKDVAINAKVRVDRTEFDSIKDKTVEVKSKVNVDRSGYDAIKDKTVEIKTTGLNTGKLSKDIEKAISGAVSDGFKAAKSFDLLGVIATPFKAAFGVIESIGSAVIGGVVRNISKGLGRGVSSSLEGSIGETISKFGPLGEQAGSKIADAMFGRFKKEIDAINKIVDRQIESLGKKKVPSPQPQKSGAEAKTTEKIKIEFDASDYDRMRQRIESMNLGLVITVDDSRLFDLNRHLTQKEEHFDRAQRKFNKPLKPIIDVSGTESLRQVEDSLDSVKASIRSASGAVGINARVNVDRSQLDAVTGKDIEIKTKAATGQDSLIDTAKLSEDLSGSIGGAITEGFKSAKSGNLIGLITAPIKGVLGVLAAIGGTVGSGLVLGLTQEVTKGLGKGLGNALEGAIAPAFGSSELLAEKAGGSLASAIVEGFKSEIAALNGLIDQQIEKIEDSNERFEARRTVTNLRGIPAAITSAAKEEIGTGEIARAQILRQGQISAKRKSENQLVNTQADEQSEKLERSERKAAPVRDLKRQELKVQFEQVAKDAEAAQKTAQALSAQISEFTLDISSLPESQREGLTQESQNKAYIALSKQFAAATDRVKQYQQQLEDIAKADAAIKEESQARKTELSNLKALQSQTPKAGPELDKLEDVAIERSRTADKNLVKAKAVRVKALATLDDREKEELSGFRENRKRAEEAQKAFAEANNRINKRVDSIQKEILALSQERDRTTDPVKKENIALQIGKLSKDVEAAKSDPKAVAELSGLAEAQKKAQEPFLEQIKALNAIQQERKILDKALSEVQADADYAYEKLIALGGRFAQEKARVEAKTSIKSLPEIRSKSEAEIKNLEAQINSRKAFAAELQEAMASLDASQESELLLIEKEFSDLNSKITEAYGVGDTALISKLQAELDSKQNSPELISKITGFETDRTAIEEPLKAELERIAALENQIKLINENIEKAEKNAEIAQKNLGILSSRDLPKQYLQLARVIAGGDVDESRLPTLVADDQKLKQMGAEASYTPAENQITLKASTLDALSKAAELSEKQLMEVAEELAHAFDFDFGSARGIGAQANRTVLPERRVQATPEELARIAPELSTYDADARELELNGKVRRDRAAKEFRELRSQDVALQRLGVLSGALDLKPLFQQYAQTISAANKIGAGNDSGLASDREKLLELKAKTEAVLAQGVLPDANFDEIFEAIRSLKGEFATVDASLKTRQKDFETLTADLKAFATLEKDPFTTPTLPEGFTERQIARVGARGDQSVAPLEDPFADSYLTPRRVGDELQFETDSQRKKRENTERTIQRREQFKQDVVAGVKAAPGKVKDFVFNKDRNIDINVDDIRDKVEATGVALYKGGLAVAKTLDTVAVVWGEFANSSAGNALLGGMGEAANALGSFTKGVYKALEGFESAAFAALPYGNEAIKPTAKALLGPGLALGAASAVPGIGSMVQGAASLGSDFANFALSPIANTVGGSIIGQGTDLINQILPQLQAPEMFGQPIPGAQQAVEAINSVRAGAIEALTTATTQGVGAAKAIVSELVTVVVGGKAIQAGAGAIAGSLPGSAENAPALMPGRDRFALPAAKQSAMPKVEIVGLDDTPSLALPPAKKERDLRDLTVAQLSAVAKQNNVSVRKQDRKEDIAKKLEQQLGYGKLDPIIDNIDSMFDRKGVPVGGFDVARETALIEQYEAKQKEINQKIRDVKKLSGVQRQKALESIAFESEAVRREIDQLETESLSGPTIGTLSKIKGSVQSRYNNAPELIEARDNRIAQRQAALEGNQAIDVSATPVNEGLARATIDNKPNLFQRATNKIRSLMPLNEKRLAKVKVNFDSIVEEVYAFSEAVGGLGDAPQLRVDDNQLKQLGADAFYEAQTNTVLISKELATILEMPAHEIAKYADKLQAVVHEARHAAQTSGGALNIDNAAKGLNVALRDASELNPREAMQARASTRAYAGKADRRNVFALEADAAIFERETPKILDNAKIRTETKLDNLPQRPLTKTGKQLADLRDAVENVVGNMIDNVRLRLTGQKELIPQARADRLQKRVASINRREAEQSIATADAAVLEIGNRQTDEETKKVKRENTRTARRVQATQREIEKKFDLSREADREIILDDSGDEGAIKSAIGTIKNSLNSVRNAITERLREQAKTVSSEAKSTLVDIRTNRLDAEAKAFDNPAAADRAKKLQALETKTEKATTGIDELTSKESLSSKDRAKLRELKAEINSVYKEIGKPLPSGSNSLLDIGDRIGGLVSKFKGLGVALLALPFAFDALQGLKQFGRDSVDAAVQFDRLRTSLSFSSGSSRAADRDLAFVDRQASTNGTDLRTGREGFASLRAATRNTGVEGEGAKNLFEGLTQASTVLGLSTEKQQKAFLALEQVASKGKLSAEELRGQLGEALPGAFGIAARSIGVTEGELNKLLETGAITADEFLPKFAQQLKSEFGGAAETASNNLQSSLFRVNNAFLKLQEATGAAISPAVKTGADALAGAIGLLADKAGSLIQIGAVLAAGFFGKGILNANLPIAGIAEKLGELGKINLSSVGKGIGAIAEKAGAAAKALAPIALEFIAIQGVIQLFSTAKDMFGLDEEGENFKRLADTAEKELDRIKGKAGKVKDSLRTPSKGFDLTFGLGDLAGVGAFRTDDILRPKKQEDPFLEAATNIARNTFNPAIDINKAITKFRGGEGVTTIGDLQKQREGIEFNRFSESLDARAGEGFDSARIADSLKAQKAAEDRVKALRGQRAALAGQPDKATEVAAIDREIKAANRERDVAAKPAADIQRAVSSGLTEARSELKKIQEKGNNITKEDQARIDVLQGNIRNLEAAQKNIDRLGLKFGTTGDATRKLITTLADLDNKLASIAEKADLKLNIDLAGNAKQALTDFGTNQFASQDGAVKDAIAQQERAKIVFEETKKAVEDAKKALSGEDVRRELDQISVGATGRKLSLDSSAEDLKTAKDGADPKQKDLIERLENFRKTRAQLPTLDREASQAELAQKQAKQAAELARIDDATEQRSIKNKRDSVARQIELNNDLVRNSFKSDEDLAIKRAELEKQSITDRSASVQAQIGELESLRERGVISAEEYVKRRRALAGEELQIASDASNAEVALKEANNAKILKGIERNARDRNLASKIANNEAQIGVVRDSLNPNVSNEQLAVRSAQVDLSGTRSELSNTKAELEDLNKAFAQGALKEEEYRDKAAALKGSISDLGLKEARAELNLRKAINEQILKQYELAKQTRELESKLANNKGRAALIRKQLDGPRKLESEDVAIESAQLDTAATDRQIANANKDLSDLREQLSRGLIKADEFKSKSMELKGALSDLSVQRLANELAEVEAKNAKVLSQFERANAFANNKIDKKAFEATFAAKQNQFTTGTGNAAEEGVKAEREAIEKRIKLKKIELEEIQMLVEERTITENESIDRTIAAETDLRSLRMSLLDSQIEEYNRAADSQIAGINRVVAAQQRAFDRQKTQLTQLTTLLERQGAVISAQKDLSNAVSAGRIGALEARANEKGEGVAAAARLRSGDIGETERSVLQKQFGISSDDTGAEVRLLQDQQAIAREIEAEKLAALDKQEQFANKLLAIEETKLRIAQQISELEAKNAEIAARGMLATSKLELAKARRTGDRESIAAASEAVDVASEGVGAAQQNTQFVKSLGGNLEQELSLKRQLSAQNSANEKNALIGQSNAAERARQRELAATIDRSGLSGKVSVGGRGPISSVSPSVSDGGGAVGGAIASTEQYQSRHLELMSKLIEVTAAKPAAMPKAPSPQQFARDEAAMVNDARSTFVPTGGNTQGQAQPDRNKYESEQLVELRNISNAIRQQKPAQTNVFQGGQSGVEQYMAVAKARQSAAK